MKKFDLAVVVDDDPTALFLAEHNLKKSGIAGTVRTIRNGPDAIALLLENDQSAESGDVHPTLVLLELRMNFMDGSELIKAIYELPLRRKPVIAILTTSIFDEDFSSAARLGISGYIIKPINTVKISKFLGEVLPAKV